MRREKKDFDILRDISRLSLPIKLPLASTGKRPTDLKGKNYCHTELVND